MPPKRKTYTAQEKVEVIKKIEQCGNLEAVSREYKIDRRCLQRWKKRKAEFLCLASTKAGYLRRRVPPTHHTSTAKYPKLETDLKAYILEKRSKG